MLTLTAALGSGKAWDRKSVEDAERQLDNFMRVLENEGVKVRRPKQLDHSVGFKVESFFSVFDNVRHLIGRHLVEIVLLVLEIL